MKFLVKIRYWVILLGLLLPLQSPIFASNLKGPLIAAIPSWNGYKVIIEDVGARHTWLYPLDEAVKWRSWSPRGCEAIIQHEDYFALLSIPDFNERLLPQPGRGWAWGVEGNTLTAASGKGEETIIRQFDLHPFHQTNWVYLERSIELGGWASETRVAYFDDGEVHIFSMIDRKTEKIIDKTEYFSQYHIDGGILLPANPLPDDWSPELHNLNMSPMRNAVSRYFESEPGLNLILKEEYGVVKEPGFDIYLYDTEELRHINLDGRYLRSLVWSPSGKLLAASTYEGEDPGSVYIYDIQTNELRKLEGVVSPYGFKPSWSPDEEWLAVRISRFGQGVYNLKENYIIELDEQFDSSPEIYWSPVMDYSETQCSASE